MPNKEFLTGHLKIIGRVLAGIFGLSLVLLIGAGSSLATEDDRQLQLTPNRNFVIVVASGEVVDWQYTREGLSDPQDCSQVDFDNQPLTNKLAINETYNLAVLEFTQADENHYFCLRAKNIKGHFAYYKYLVEGVDQTPDLATILPEDLGSLADDGPELELWSAIQWFFGLQVIIICSGSLIGILFYRSQPDDNQ